MSTKWLSAIIAMLLVSEVVVADIQFEEVTEKVNMGHAGQSYGAAWGDFNGDRWPDLWVGNHNSKPSLYLNKQDGTFDNIIDNIWNENPEADTHGAAWADFDNDGDQDLVEIVGATVNNDGTLCFGCGRNHLFVNDQGKLIESARTLGVAVKGLGRSPLWLDANNDGRLDLLAINTRNRSRGMPSSTLFIQQAARFVAANDEIGFVDEEWSTTDHYLAMLYNALDLNFEDVGLLHMDLNQEHAQLTRLLDDKRLDLVFFSSPTRLFSLVENELNEETAAAGFPSVDTVSDVAIADYNGDGQSDMYLTKGPFLVSDVVQLGDKEIRGSLMGRRGGQIKSVDFQTDGSISVEIHPTFLKLSNIFLGHQGRNPVKRLFRLSDDDVSIHGPEFPETVKHKGVAIFYDTEKKSWTIRNTSRSAFVDFIVKSEKPVKNIQMQGFRPFAETGADVLLIREGGKFARRAMKDELANDTSCHSVAEGDFDNDQDIDLYLVCSGPVQNIPNRLLENDGSGNFKEVKYAGGAEGSHLGRGDVVALADYDHDGFLDLFITNGLDPASPFVAAGPHQLYRNKGNNNHWLEIDLEGQESNRDGIGATVWIDAGGHKQVREQRGGYHRIAQNFQRLHFGLGSNEKIDRLKLRWPSGMEQEFTDISADQIVKITESGGLVEID
ncbi:MAG: CRTAC1 family protein [Gammaproteobacteria bacterium]